MKWDLLVDTHKRCRDLREKTTGMFYILVSRIAQKNQGAAKNSRVDTLGFTGDAHPEAGVVEAPRG